MMDREEYFSKAAARQSLFCAVWIVALLGGGTNVSIYTGSAQRNN